MHPLVTCSHAVKFFLHEVNNPHTMDRPSVDPPRARSPVCNRGALQTALEGVGAPWEDSRASCPSPRPGPGYQQGARPFGCAGTGCGWGYLQEVLKERENAGSVSLKRVWGGLPWKQRPRILQLWGFHLVFDACASLAHFPSPLSPSSSLLPSFHLQILIIG